jgi:hypothetical protein
MRGDLASTLCEAWLRDATARSAPNAIAFRALDSTSAVAYRPEQVNRGGGKTYAQALDC